MSDIIWQTLILAVLTLGTFAWSRWDYSKLSDRINTLSNMISQVIGFTQGKSDHPFVPVVFGEVSTGEMKSPATLNDKGKKIADKLKAYELVEKYHPKILIPEDANEFYIQNLCFAFVHTSLLKTISRSERDPIEKEIYENGGNINNVLYVYAILFRDFFLKKYGHKVPEYTVTQDETK